MKLADENILTDDVRMRGFKQRSTVDQVIAWLDQQSIALNTEAVALQQAVGRVLVEDVISSSNIPRFNRSMMDGYALCASDTQGASSYNPLHLRLIGKSMPGYGADVAVHPGTAVKIMTGAPLPDGANAVLPAENVELEGDHVMVLETVAEGRNIGRIGEDIQEGETIFLAGRKLRPQDIALLASIGKSTVPVQTRIKVHIVVTGNEILAVGQAPKDFQITNSNGPMLETLCQRDGAEVTFSTIIADDAEKIEQAMLADYDVLLITGGSSVGEEDLVPLLTAKLGKLLFHGVTMRPSRSTGLGLINNKKVFLLPGNPVACLCAYDFFAGRLLRRVSGQPRNWPYFTVTKTLSQKITSMLGRTDYARVRLTGSDEVEPIAISGAGIISSTTQADGFILVPANSEGYAAGEQLTVYLYD